MQDFIGDEFSFGIKDVHLIVEFHCLGFLIFRELGGEFGCSLAEDQSIEVVIGSFIFGHQMDNDLVVIEDEPSFIVFLQ